MLLTDVVDDSVINDTVDSLEDRFPGVAFGKRVDVTDEKQVIAGFEHMRDALGGCDILINNAGTIGRTLRTSLPLVTSIRCLRSTSEARFFVAGKP